MRLRACWRARRLPEFFAEVERTRAELDPYIARFADFAGAREKRLLEIGVGLGTDFIRFVRAGAIATGVDLTEHAVQAGATPSRAGRPARGGGGR